MCIAIDLLNTKYQVAYCYMKEVNIKIFSFISAPSPLLFYFPPWLSTPEFDYMHSFFNSSIISRTASRDKGAIPSFNPKGKNQSGKTFFSCSKGKCFQEYRSPMNLIFALSV